MEYFFLNTDGDLACKLMAALQGAKRIGADTRCAPHGTSSLFAFLKVAQPSDLYQQPSFSIGVKTGAMDNIEPIDSLQTLFDKKYNCDILSPFNPAVTRAAFRVFPNPFEKYFKVQPVENLSEKFQVELFDVHGTLVTKNTLTKNQRIDTVHLPDGIYFLKLFNEKKSFVRKVIKAKPKP
ncbi:MAG: T9SS type A sorting domain-containing protein [Saprospiraceae bacterium]